MISTVGEGVNGRTDLKVPNWNKAHTVITSYDRGCGALNSVHHKEVSDAQANDPDFAARKMLEIYKGNHSTWRRWCSSDTSRVTKALGYSLGKAC